MGFPSLHRIFRRFRGSPSSNSEDFVFDPSVLPPLPKGRKQQWERERPWEEIEGLEPAPLDEVLRSNEHTRILLLYPPGWPGQLGRHDTNPIVHCTSFQARFDILKSASDDQPNYMALSYCWGDPSRTRQILCDGLPVPVTENLYQALVWIRFAQQPRLVWADAICIHQDNDAEKSVQVARMGSIYSNAHVVSWLGTPVDIPYLEATVTMMEMVVRLSKLQSPDYPDLLYRDYLSPESIRVRRACGIPYFKDPRWAILRLLFNRPIFTRLWVVQEHVLARSNLCQAGPCRFALDTLESAEYAYDSNIFCNAAERDHRYETFGNNGLSGLYMISIHSDPYSASVGLHPVEAVKLVLDFSKQLCTDSRDHIYALVSVFEESYVVDYSLSVAQVFTDFTAFWIRGTSSLNFLDTKINQMSLQSPTNSSGSLQHDQWLEDLPSWVPSYATSDRHSSDWPFDEQRYHAAGNSSPRGLVVKDATLCLQGMCVTGIRERSEDPIPHIGNPQFHQSTFMTNNQVTILLQLFRAFRIPEDEMFNLMRTIKLQSFLLDLTKMMGIHRLLPLFTEILCCKFDKCSACSQSPDENRRDPKDHTLQITCPKNEGFSTDLWRATNPLDEGTDRWFRTGDERPGLGLGQISSGDQVFILYGSSVPFILRPTSTAGNFKLVGMCYVTGIMKGEALDMGLKDREVRIV